MSRFSLLLPLLMITACDALTGAGARPEGTREVRLSIPDALVRSLGTRSTPLQLAGVVVRPDGSFSVYTTAAVDPAADAQLSGFWPAQESFSLVVQSPAGGSAGQPGAMIARVRFQDGLGASAERIPAGGADLDLGTPVFTAGAVGGAGAVLAVEDTHNPLALVDSDGDGASDLVDLDDDEDGADDGADDDRDGDGVLDAEQGLDALADADANGVPDLFE